MKNIDIAEIDKFSAQASTWWDPKGPMETLHLINPLRLNFIEEHSPLSNKKVLDIGCGGGILSESLAQKGAKVTGIDLSKEVIEIARLHQLESKLIIDYQHIDAQILAEQSPGEFDMIICMELLEHVPKPELIIQACRKLIKPDGDLFFSTINRTWKAYLFAIVGAEYVLNWVPQGTHEYDKLIQPAELASWLRDNQLNINTLKGMSYQPLSNEFYLSEDVSINYLIHAKTDYT